MLEGDKKAAPKRKRTSTAAQAGGTKKSRPRKTAATSKTSARAGAKSTAKAPAARSSARRRSAARSTAASNGSREAASTSARTTISGEQRHRMIAEAAYRKSIHRRPADPVLDWLEAEKEIDDLLTRRQTVVR